MVPGSCETRRCCDERREQSKGQRHESVRQEQRSDDELGPEDQRHHVAGLRHRVGEGGGTFRQGGRWRKIQ
jgi:hypothetical protein